MADTKTRVHNLAKELGVPSKAIIDKCRSEGIEIPNHMQVLSAGLEATIREWFSEGAHTTTEEHAERVNLDKVRKPRKKKAAGDESPGGIALAEPPATHEAPPEPPPARPAVEPVVVPPPAVVPPAPVQVAAEAPRVEPAPPVTPIVAPPPPVEWRPAAAAPEPPAPSVAAPAAAPPAAAAVAPTQKAAKAPAPPAEAKPPSAPVRPAGPQNIPRPAQLQGPRVVRMDRPETVSVPRPSGRTGPGYGGPPRGGPSTMSPAEQARRRGLGRGRTAEDEEAARKGPAARSRANPRRSLRDSLPDVNEKIREFTEQDRLERQERLDHAIGRTHRAIEKRAEKAAAARPAARPSKVEITEPVVIKEFCRVTGIRSSQVISRLMAEGIMGVTQNKVIDAEMAQLLALENGIELMVKPAPSPLEALKQARADMERTHLKIRPPIVTILGHVDHGKTSLLDRIRQTNVAAGEAGGITQHIGAYTVKVGDRSVTFLDTPGHAAFTAMRARGAHMTDVAVLVVAADDGVMPQTIEAINHARAAKVPIVVALNKIDLPGVDINKIYGQLAEQQLTPQQWGGDTDVIHTSAATGQGIDELLAHLAAMSDLMELKADATVPASGTVIEAQMLPGMGQVARVMVREGTLRNGSVVVCGPGYGKVRAMRDDKGRRIDKAGPATPVEITGLSDLPAAGDEFFEVDDLQQAKEVAEEVQRQRREAELSRLARATDMSEVFASVGDRLPELNLIVKADVGGSADVLKKQLSEIPSDRVKLNLLHVGVGAVSDGDVMLAAASQALIVGFNVVPDPQVQRLADEHRVQIRTYRVIYELEGDVRQALAGLLPTSERIESRGRAEVREVFNITRVGRIAGCLVRDGVIARNHMVRVLRDNVPIKEKAALASLKRFKEDAREVRAGLECGIRIDGFDDVKPGDVIESYEVVSVAGEL